MTRYWLPACTLFFAAFATAATAAEPPCAVDAAHRAGYPHCVHRLARPGYGSKYQGGIVGGGSWLGGGDPTLAEGTWGVDYAGVVPLKRIWLGWSHHRYQAGGGRYESDRRAVK